MILHLSQAMRIYRTLMLCLMNFLAKYICKNEGKNWTYKEAKSIILESVEMSQSMNFIELEKLADEQIETYPLGPTIALAYLSVLEDCEVHCLKEGAEVKSLGGLHVIGTSLHESRRIDNQVGFPSEISFFIRTMILVQNGNEIHTQRMIWSM